MSISRALCFGLLVAFFATDAAAAPVRLKELADVRGVRDNALIGYGLVVGLAGTGDTESVLFTSQSMAGMLGRLGIRIDPRDVRVRNVAAVMVTATLPAFSRSGSRLDVSVSSIGNARSLVGGTLLLTPLRGPDGKTYAVGQGAVQAGGLSAAGLGNRFQRNTPTAGRIPAGATIERAVKVDLDSGPVVLALRSPDFTTANRVAARINKRFAELGNDVVKAVAKDPAAVEINLPEDYEGGAVALLAEIEALEVDADERAKVVVSERTGTVVAGANVRLRPVVVAHGNFSVAVDAKPVVSQPNPFTLGGQTVTQRQGDLKTDEANAKAIALPQTSSVQELAAALNLLGASPRDLISILQAMKAAGALDADLEVL